jgi:hypothetical protein
MKRSDVHLRVPPELLAWVRADANDAMRSMNNQIIDYIKRAMAEAKRQSRAEAEADRKPSKAA